MPIQKRTQAENMPISFRPGALQRERLDQLLQHRQQNQSAVLNASIDLLWLFDIGHVKLGEIQDDPLLKKVAEYRAKEP